MSAARLLLIVPDAVEFTGLPDATPFTYFCQVNVPDQDPTIGSAEDAPPPPHATAHRTKEARESFGMNFTGSVYRHSLDNARYVLRKGLSNRQGR